MATNERRGIRKGLATLSVNDDEYCAFWDKYFELEFDGAPKVDVVAIIQLAEMMEEGRHYIGVSLIDHESAP